MANITKQTVGFVLTSFCHILVVTFVVYMLYVNINQSTASESVLLRWHMCLMTMGFGALMSEAIMSITPDNLISYKLSRKTRVTTHWALQILAVSCIVAALAVVVVWKENNSIPHFESPHSIVGLTAIVLSCLASAGGIAALFSMELKNVMRPVVTKLIHNVAGEIAFTLGVITLILGLYSRGFADSSTFLGRVLCTEALIVVVLFSVFSACIAAYDKLKIVLR